jgi:hypothetical protein
MDDLKMKALNERRELLQNGIGAQENFLHLMKWLVVLHLESKEIPQIMRSEVTACLTQWKNSLMNKGVSF